MISVPVSSSDIVENNFNNAMLLTDFCILFCEMCTYWVVLLSVDVIKFVFYIDIARPTHLMCVPISSRTSFIHCN